MIHPAGKLYFISCLSSIKSNLRCRADDDLLSVAVYDVIPICYKLDRANDTSMKMRYCCCCC